STAAASRRSNPTSEWASASVHTSPYSATRANSLAIQYGSVSTSVPSMSHSTADSSVTADSVPLGTGATEHQAGPRLPSEVVIGDGCNGTSSWSPAPGSSGTGADGT